MAESQTAAAAAAEEEKHPPFLIEVVIRLVREKPLATFGGVIVLILFVAGIFAGWPPFADVFGGESKHLLAPYGSNAQDWGARLQGPSAKYLLGTDNLGRDLLSRIIFGV